jgi:cell division septation protein DedD
MAEIRRGFGDEGQDTQRLPWLEAVDDDDDDFQPDAGTPGWLKGVLILIVAAAVALGAMTLLNRWQAQRSDLGTLIKADPAPYKIRPPEPGGLQVDNNDRIAQRTGVGGDINSPLDLAALPEEPIVGAGAPPVPRAEPAASAPAAASAPVAAAPRAPAPAARPIAPPPAAAVPAPVTLPKAAPAAKPVAGGGAAQLGAFSSEAKANAAWKTLSKRFAYLAPLTPVILPVKSGDATLYRLRATGGSAAATCAKLKVAGEACAVVN